MRAVDRGKYSEEPEVHSCAVQSTRKVQSCGMPGGCPRTGLQSALERDSIPSLLSHAPCLAGPAGWGAAARTGCSAVHAQRGLGCFPSRNFKLRAACASWPAAARRSCTSSARPHAAVGLCRLPAPDRLWRHHQRAAHARALPGDAGGQAAAGGHGAGERAGLRAGVPRLQAAEGARLSQQLHTAWAPGGCPSGSCARSRGSYQHSRPAPHPRPQDLRTLSPYSALPGAGRGERVRLPHGGVCAHGDTRGRAWQVGRRRRCRTRMRRGEALQGCVPVLSPAWPEPSACIQEGS